LKCKSEKNAIERSSNVVKIGKKQAKLQKSGKRNKTLEKYLFHTGLKSYARNLNQTLNTLRN